MDTLRHLFSICAAFALVGGAVVVATHGCNEPAEQLPDTRVPAPDGGGASCGDALPNAWTPTTQQAASLGDGGTLATLFGAWGASEKEIFAVGAGGKVIFYDGKEWKSQATPTTQNLTDVWGTAANDVWAVGFSGTVIHYDGTGWKDLSPAPLVFYTGDGGGPKGDAAEALKKNLWGVWATGKTGTDAVYAVGDNGTVLHFDGKTKVWSDRIPITAAGSPIRVQDQLNAVWGTSADSIVVVGNFGTVLTGSKAGLAVQKTGITKDLNAVWGRSGSEIYAVGTGGTVLVYRGSWKTVSGAPKQVLRGVWGPSHDNSYTYVVGWDGTLLKMSGGPSFSQGATFDSFHCIVPGRRLESIWGTLVPRPPMDAGLPDAKLPRTEAGVPLVPAAWIVGASGMVVRGP